MLNPSVFIRFLVACLIAALPLNFAFNMNGMLRRINNKIISRRNRFSYNSIVNYHQSKALHFSQRPDFEAELDAKYFDFQKLENIIYKWWDESDNFKPKPKAGVKPYVIPMPPPNVTGYLHMGHAMFIALQDIMARFNRMRGIPTLWIPGT
jgi:valyl-tRNA synthetase